MRVLLLISALALSACGTTPAGNYASADHRSCAMTNARDHAACVHSAGVKRAAVESATAR